MKKAIVGAFVVVALFWGSCVAVLEALESHRHGSNPLGPGVVDVGEFDPYRDLPRWRGYPGTTDLGY